MNKEKFDIVVVGGGPAGIISAVTARRYYPDKKIILIKSVGKGVIPCGIPYMFATLEKPEENALGNAPLEKNDIPVMVDEVVKIDRKGKSIRTKDGQEMTYQKLILAVGSDPVIPPIKGLDKKGVYPIYKDLGYLKGLKEDISRTKNVLIIGGGFIGIEFADELSKIKGLKVFLVELFPHLLMNSFDPEFGEMVEQKLKAKGVNLLFGKKVEEILGENKVSEVCLSDKTCIPADMVILGIGAVPNTKLAQDAGLDLGRGKGIWADEYMRTPDPDVFAVGDCVGKRDFFTRKNLPVMLASTATAEARVAGSNLYQLKVVRENKGTIAIYSTYVDGLVLGSAGLTEASAKKENFEVVVGKGEVPDKHPASLPGTKKIKLKLIFSKQSGIILGGQVAGGISAGEIINIIGLAIQQRVSATELETLQMATHPHLTAPPTMYPLVLAAQDAAGKI
ncbi:MAG: FAD-dependent oxidoreductase [Candidatus Margulisiibacteriota bacterium]|nr:FAD-dependent oxidoreductase [Candidatus Margulisiibacteriota bacterium]